MVPLATIQSVLAANGCSVDQCIQNSASGGAPCIHIACVDAVISDFFFIQLIERKKSCVYTTLKEELRPKGEVLL